jgi:putative CocE/NonD family hydrolase
MQRIVFFILFLACVQVAGAQRIGTAKAREHYDKIETYIPMRDGVKLFTAIYIPKDTTQTYPILLTRTPYSIRPYGEQGFPRRLGPSREMMQDGYIFVYQDVRGRWMSEGLFDEMRPFIPVKGPSEIDESTDTYDTIEWLLENLRNDNGKVGMWGISYSGFYTSMGLLSRHPALKAASPQGPIADLWRDDAFHNGMFLIPHNFNFYPYFTNRTDDKPTQAQAKGFQHGTNDGYQYFLDLGPLKNSLDIEAFADDPYWKANLEHPTYDAFWQARNILPHLAGVEAAVMVVGGWYDAEDLYGTFNTYQAIERKNPEIDNFFVVGPWSHGGWAWGPGEQLGKVRFDQQTGQYYRKEIEREFFRFYLKGEGEGAFPEARMFETGANRWRTFDTWPPREAREERLYFHPLGRLALGQSPNLTGPSYSEYPSNPNDPVPALDYPDIGMPREYMVSDQRHAAKRPDVLSFQTEVLADSLTLAGPIEVCLQVSTTGSDADWIVKLIDVYPENAPDSMGGYQQMVRTEFFRGRYRKSPEHPEPFEPGKVEEVVFDLQDVLHTFPKGHRVMVQVQSTFFPIVDRNPQTYVPNIFYAEEKDFRKALHRLYHDASHTSYLTVRVMDQQR